MPVCAQNLSHKHQKDEEWNSGPNEAPGALTLSSGKARFHHGFFSKSLPVLSQLSQASFSLSLIATWQGVKAHRRTDGRNSLSKWIGTWSRVVICPGMVVLHSESPILVWELGGCLPEETCFILQGEVALAAISSFLEMSNTEMSSLWNGCPALL